MTIEELEILRKKAKNTILICMIFTIILPSLLFYITSSEILLIIALIISIIMSIMISYNPKQKFIISYKEMFVLKALKSIFTNLKYDPDKGISESIIRNTQMMNMGDQYSSNDYISAKYKNINIIQADVHIKEEYEIPSSNGNKKRKLITIFKGKWMIFDFNKNFKANLQVSQKGFLNSKINKSNNKNKYHKIQLEDQEFNNEFRIYAQNEHEAFYILTPALMEKIKKLTNTINGKILLCFIDNKLHVGIQNNKDSFEHNIFKKIDENKVINEISKDIKLITNFVDELDLDNNLFRKEV